MHLKFRVVNQSAKRKPSIQDLMRYHMRNYLLPKWGKTPVEFITANAVNEWVGAPELAHLSPVTMKGIVTTCSLLLEKVQQRGHFLPGARRSGK
jgi:hypothetical protein